jgi:hypothetical protein
LPPPRALLRRALAGSTVCELHSLAFFRDISATPKTLHFVVYYMDGRTIQVGEVSFSVRQQTYTLTVPSDAAGFGHGSDISVSR